MVTELITKMSKFRARQLDASKPIPIYLQDDIKDYTEFHNATNRTVPQMPTGMEKEEEAEHHLQEAIFRQKIIPVPEVFDTTTTSDGLIFFDKIYPSSYKLPRQMIHIHPFSAEQDIPDYDLDSEDEVWIGEYAAKGELPLDYLQFEEMMDRLEKASGLKAVTLQEAKLLLKDDDDLITAVYDYWLNKRLRLQHPLIPHVRSEKGSNTGSNDPYVAFRKRTEKMQTRKNRKNEESSYERMLKLKRDLVRAVTLLEMVKKREKSKRELLHLNIEVFEKRYELGDYSGTLLAEVSALRTQRPAFAPLISNHQMQTTSYGGGTPSPGTATSSWLKVPSVSHSHSKVSKKREDGKRERRTYKKWRKHSSHHISSSTPSSSVTPSSTQSTTTYSHPPDPYSIAAPYPVPGGARVGTASTNVSEDEAASASHSEPDEDSSQGLFTFKRKKYVNYHPPREGNWPWVAPNEGGAGDPKYRFSLASISQPNRRCIGYARRRLGRGGRVWIDRINSPLDDLWVKKDFHDPNFSSLDISDDFIHEIKTEWPHYCPKSPRDDPDTDVEIDVESVGVPVTLSTEDVSLSTSDDIPPSTTPTSLLISAEILEGECRGAISDVEITLPPGLDSLLSNSNVLLEDNLQMDIQSDGENSYTNGGGKVSFASRCSSVDSLKPSENSGGKSLPIVNEMSESEWPSGSKYSGNSNKLKIGSGHESYCKLLSHHNVQHSTDFITQPSSRFNILEYSNSSLPLTVPGLQLGSGSGSGSEESFHNQSSLSSSKSCSISSNSMTTHTPSSSSSCSINSCSSIVSISTTSLSNSISSWSTVQRKGSVSADKVSINENDNSNKLKLSSLIIKEPTTDMHSVISNKILFPNTKNNGSNILGGSVTNNLTSQKLFPNRTNENLKGSDSLSGTITNGPNSNTLQNSKCATKKDHYVFHES